MKKLIFGGLAIAALAAGGFLLSESRTQAYDLTSAQLSNLDALTDIEMVTGGPWKVTFYSSSHWVCEHGGSFYCPL